MVQTVQDEQGIIHSFPDDATPDEMNEAIGSMQKKKMDYMLGSHRTPVDQIRDVAQGVLTGMGKGGQAIASLLTGGYAPKVDFDQILSPVGSPNRSMGGDILKGAGSYAPYAIAGGPGLLGGIAAGLAHGAATSEPGERHLFGLMPEGRTGGALTEALINAMTHGGLRALEALRPSKMFRGELSPDQLQKNLDVTQGTETSLGDVVGSPFLKRQYENVLPRLPFSGANESMMRTANQVRQQGQGLMDELGVPEDTGELAQNLQNALKSAAKEARAGKTENYATLNKMADEAGLNVGRDNFAQAAQAALDDIKLSPELEKEFDPGFMADLQRYAKNPEGNNLKLSNIFKGKLGDKANDYYTQGGKMYEFGIAKNLQDALQKDIDSAIEGSGNQAIKDQYLKSQEDYAKKFAPFEDPDIVKFTRQGGDSDLMLSHFLRTGATDRGNLLSKLQTKLSPEKKLTTAQLYLSRAIEDGEVNPLKLRTLYNKLGESQKNALFGDSPLRQKLEKYMDLVGKNTEPLTIMFNPKTGQRNLDALTAGTLGLVGHAMGGNPGAAVLGGVPIAAGRMATKALTSPSIRESLVKEMLNPRRRFGGAGQTIGAQTLEQALAEYLSKGNSDNGY